MQKILTYLRPHALIILSVIPLGLAADTFTEGGDAYKRGDFATAAEKFEQVAERGDHRAMYALGSMYAGGTGVKQDYKQAFQWFSQAARYGRLDAKYKIGLMYELGVGVRQDYRRAARYYLDVGREGYAHGQFKLGQLYLKGHGVKQDLSRAFAWMATARQNFLNAMPADESGNSDENNTRPVDELQTTDIFATIHLKLINSELEKLKAGLSQAQQEQAQDLAREFIQYQR